MIAPMAKALVVGRQEQKAALLTELRKLGVIHLVPVLERDDGGDGSLADALAGAERAFHALSALPAQGGPVAGPAAAIIEETNEIRRRETELHARLTLLEAEAEHAGRWGRITRAQLEALEHGRAEVQLLNVPEQDVKSLRAALVHVVDELARKRSLVLLVRPEPGSIPPGAEVVPPPVRGLPAILAEAAEAQAELAAGERRLAELAGRLSDVARELEELRDRVDWTRALRSGWDDPHLFGVQGWVPLARADSLAAELRAAGVTAAVHARPAEVAERPPTLLSYPRWLRPIRGVFDLLGIRPGYDEMDPSSFFMVAVPLFAGMIIGDAGYGLLFLLVSLLGRRRLRPLLGAEKLHLLALFGVAALLWGTITGSWFGVNPPQMRAGGGWVAGLGWLLDRLQRIRGTEEETRTVVFKICFLLGSIHLILAHARRTLTLAPHSSSLAELGWCGVLAGMLAVIWQLFFGEQGPLPDWLTRALFGSGMVGFALVAGFSAAGPGLFRRVALGTAGALLPLLGTFGDTLSYIRLAAAGLAGYYLAVASNTLAASAAETATWAAGVPVLLLGHSLNIALILIAIFAHGVRLNLLEFSSNAGIQWTGYPYQPFAQRTAKEF